MLASNITSVFIHALSECVIRVQPVVDKDELAVGFRFVSQAVLGAGPRSLKRNLLAAGAVQAVARAKISVEFETAHLLLQLLDLLIGLPQQVICRLRGYLALEFCADLI